MLDGVQHLGDVPFQQGVDDIEARDGSRRSEARAQPAGSGHDLELVVKEKQDQQGQPEAGHADAGDGDGPDDLVGDAVALDGGDDAEENAEQRRDDDGPQGQLDGGREAALQLGEHRVVGADGGTQVQLEQVAHVIQVLGDEGLVQPVAQLIGRHDVRVAEGPLAQIGGDGVAGDELGEEEHQGRHADEHDDQVDQPLSDKSQPFHSCSLPLESFSLRRLTDRFVSRTAPLLRGGSRRGPSGPGGSRAPPPGPGRNRFFAGYYLKLIRVRSRA